MIKSHALYQTELSGTRMLFGSVGNRTWDLSVNSRPLCQLSHASADLVLASVRQPGVEPGSRRWQRRILTVEPLARSGLSSSAGLEPAISRFVVSRRTIGPRGRLLTAGERKSRIVF